VRTRIKVCGITTPEDAAMAANAGADAIGVVLTESPRRVSLDRAREIARAVPALVHIVGVFADESPEAVARAIADLPLHAVQVRGWIALEPSLACDVWHVLRNASLPEPSSLPMVPLRTYLLDSHDPASPGGTGRRADWDWARRGVNAGLRLYVAGGLNAANVAELVLEVHPFGVDASSGLELAPGRKDPAKVHAFIERIREADRIRPKQS
jgi:phosphoribosylanthranilate isomerase